MVEYDTASIQGLVDRIKELEAELDALKAECGRLRDIEHKQLDYGIILQRMIESICDGRPIPEEGRDLHHAELIRNSAFIIRRP